MILQNLCSPDAFFVSFCRKVKENFEFAVIVSMKKISEEFLNLFIYNTHAQYILKKCPTN